MAHSEYTERESAGTGTPHDTARFRSPSSFNSPDSTALSKRSQNDELPLLEAATDPKLEMDADKPSWLQRMSLRLRKPYEDKADVEEDEDENENNGLLSGTGEYRHPVSKSSRAQRTWFNYCIFGGISGLAILLFLLALNLLLMVANVVLGGDIHSVLGNWGKPGTSSEGLAWYPTDFTRNINPIPCHSHNDYWRKVPLFSALEAGCIGVEADVWLFDEDLYVGHNTASLTRNRTFQSLYVTPLVEILERQNPETEFYNGTQHGVFDADSGQTLILLVDLKTSGAQTWPYVLRQLEPLRERGWLSFVSNDKLHTRPITVVGTGNTPFDLLTANTTYRDAFFDAPLDTMWEPRSKTQNSDGEDMDPNADDGGPSEDLFEGEGSAEEDTFLASLRSPASSDNEGQGKSGISAATEFNPLNSYYASVSFGASVGHVWRGKLSSRQMKVIRGQVRGAHRRGLKVRYWDLPSWPLGLRNHVWEVLIKENVDILNVDDLRAASKLVW